MYNKEIRRLRIKIKNTLPFKHSASGKKSTVGQERWDKKDQREGSYPRKSEVKWDSSDQHFGLLNLYSQDMDPDDDQEIETLYFDLEYTLPLSCF